MLPQVTHLLQGKTREELVLAAVLLLTTEGYVVEMPGRWETRAELCQRLKIPPSTLKRRLKRLKWAPAVEMERGPTGRLIRLRSNPSFERWLLGKGSS